MVRKPAPEKRAYSLEEAIELSKKKLDNVDYSQGGEIAAAIEEGVSKAKNGLQKLAAAPMDKSMDKRLYSAARESRTQLILRIQHMLDSIALPKDNTYAELDRLRTSLADGMGQASQGNIKHGFYASTVFKNEMTDLGKRLKELERLQRNLSSYLDSATKQTRSYRRLLESVDAKEKLEKEIKALEASLERLNKRQETLRKDTAALKVPEITQGNKDLEEQRRNTESQIYSMVASLSKPLKKYEKIGNFEKPVGISVHGYITEPVRTVLEGRKHLDTILTDLERLIRSDQIELRGNAKEKALSMIGRLKGNELEQLIAKHQDALSKIKAADEKLRPLIRERAKVEKEVSGKQGELKKVESEIGQKESELKDKKQELQKQEREAKFLLSEVA